METPADDSQVSPSAGNGAGGHALAAIEPLEGGGVRRGFITDAAKKKVPIENIKRVTGQRSSNVVMNYIAAVAIDEQPPLLEIVNGTKFA